MSDNFVADKDWEEIKHRADLSEQLSQGDVKQTMRVLGVSRARLFPPVKQFREDGRTCAMLFNTGSSETLYTCAVPGRPGDARTVIPTV